MTVQEEYAKRVAAQEHEARSPLCTLATTSPSKNPTDSWARAFTASGYGYWCCQCGLRVELDPDGKVWTNR